MVTISLRDAQKKLAALIASMKPGEEVLITDRNQPVARLVVEPRIANANRQPGSAVGVLQIVEDDQSHLDDFREYMQ